MGKCESMIIIMSVNCFPGNPYNDKSQIPPLRKSSWKDILLLESIYFTLIIQH